MSRENCCAPLPTTTQFWDLVCSFFDRPTSREQNLRLARGDQRSRRRKFQLDHFRGRHLTRRRDWRCRCPNADSTARPTKRRNAQDRLAKRATGIEPAWPAWKAGTLPLSYARAKNKLPRHPIPAKLFLARRRFDCLLFREAAASYLGL
jgi:hypothetical protein